MKTDRITFDPNVMGGKPCIRGMRVTVGMILGYLAGGATREELLDDFPYLEPEDIDQALAHFTSAHSALAASAAADRAIR